MGYALCTQTKLRLAPLYIVVLSAILFAAFYPQCNNDTITAPSRWWQFSFEYF